MANSTHQHDMPRTPGKALALGLAGAALTVWTAGCANTPSPQAEQGKTANEQQLAQAKQPDKQQQRAERQAERQTAQARDRAADVEKAARQSAGEARKPAQAKQSSDRDMRFLTAPAMYSANEEWLTFACELPDGQVNIGSSEATEMYYYSRYGLGNLLFRSGMGVHIVHNPLFKMHAQNDKGMPWYQKPNGPAMFFQHKLKQFVKRTGADKLDKQFPPKGVYPIYLEYRSGKPAFMTQPVLSDFETLRWDPEQMDKSMTPAGWGQSMMKQVLWARDFFTNHKTLNGVAYLGNLKDDGGNGFRGAALIAQAITKSFALKSSLAYNAKTGELGGVNPKTYDPAEGPVYYPHEYEVVFADNTPAGKPPKPERFKITDKSSDLFDVASLLWAESEFYFFTDPKIEDDYDKVFGDPKWNPEASDEKLREWFKQGKTIFPQKPHKLSKGLTAVNVKNLKALHFNEQHGTLVDRWTPQGQGEFASLQKIGMAMAALGNTYEHMHDVAKLRGAAKKMIQAQANFLLEQQAADGSFANAYRLTSGGVEAHDSPNSLLAQASAIRGLLAAYYVTDNEALIDAAEKTYRFMEQELWSDEAGIYRAHVDADRSTYDGYNFAATLGALRELAIVHEGEQRDAIVKRLDAFFDKIGQREGLQLAEIHHTGEPIPSLAERKQKQQQLQELMQQNPEKAKQMKQQMMDSDGDGVPKPPFVKGTKYGAAPVQAASVTIDTP